MFRWHVVSAVFSRNFKHYFTSVLGYLFIFVFVTVCAALTFSQQFFADNLANLDQLSRYFPFLLLFFIPAVTMSIWADEKKQGTDAILFTLPASDFEILLGKFLSVVAVYTVALVFSGTQLIALARLGNPDWGVIATTYLGYWLAGVALLSIGMFASSLTRSTTVAFVVGALLCAIPVLFGSLMEGNRFFESYGLAGQMRDFTVGLVSLPGVVYFLSITVFMLYLNLVVISKRHWSRGRQVSLSSHFAGRIIALGVALFAINVLAEKSSSAFNNRVDLTSESLFTLDQTTRDTIAAAERNERPVTIQAFLSPDVPRKYVNTRKSLLGMLRQYDRLGGSHIDVRFVDVEPNSPQVEEATAQEIKPRASREEVGGRIIEQDVFLGVVLESKLDRVVLPFIDTDTSIEYQLTRSLATVTSPKRRLKIGILKNDLHFDNIQYQGREYDWLASRTMLELKNQYEVVTVSPEELPSFAPPKDDAATSQPDDGKSPTTESGESDPDGKTEASLKDEEPADNDEESAEEEEEEENRLDVLIVASPSTLDMVGMFYLNAYIEAGNPTLLMMDPLPFYNRFTWQYPRQFGVINAPMQPRIDEQAGWAVILPTTQEKAFGGTAQSLLDTLGIQWAHDRTVWSLFNPHVGFKPAISPNLGERWPDEYGPKQNLFVFAKSYADHRAFNPEHPISGGLHELMFIYPGSLAPNPPSQDAQGETVEAKTAFAPLVMLKAGYAGHLTWDELTEDLVSEQLQINQFTGETKLITGPETNPATGHTTRNLRAKPKLRRTAAADEQASTEEDDDEATGATSDESTANGDETDESSEDDAQRGRLDDFTHVLAAHIKGKRDRSKINAVVIADVDFVSDLFFTQRDNVETPLDNYTFFVNCIEVLAGDESLVRLRNRRPVPRTLTTIERMTEPFKLQAVREQENAEAAFNEKMVEAEERARVRDEELSADEEMSVAERSTRSIFSRLNEETRLLRQNERLQSELDERVEAIQSDQQQKTQSVESWVRWLSILSAGLPALFLGSLVLLVRTFREQRQIDPQRRV